jgi:antitoxin MazE
MLEGAPAMSRAIIGKWGKSLAVRVPGDVARAAGLREGDNVDVERIDGAIVIRPDQNLAAQRQRARAAMAEIRAAASGVQLGGLSVRQLRDDHRP